MSYFLIVNAGTTNARVTLTNESAAPLAVFSSDAGVRHTAIDGHNGKLKHAIKIGIAAVLEQANVTMNEIKRVIAYGMITSPSGLLEVRHLCAPSGIADLRGGMVSRIFPEICPLPFEFIPGVRNLSEAITTANAPHMDMMRGEETEVCGLNQLLAPSGACTLVLPGSHNKFIALDAHGNIRSCMTSISGELLDALTHHTIIADAVDRRFVDAGAYDRASFLAGVAEHDRGGIGRAVFTARILRTVGGESRDKTASYLLGVVLGADMAALSAYNHFDRSAPVFIAGKEPLARALHDAMTQKDITSSVVDENICANMGTVGALAITGELD